MVRRQALEGALAFLAGPAGPACAPIGFIPVQRPAGLAAVPVAIDGAATTMLIDTGAERSLLTKDAVTRLGLKLDPWVGTTLRGAGGRIEEHQNAIVHRLALGGTLLTQRGAETELSLAVSKTITIPGAEGLIGGDLLAAHDIDLDLRQGRLALVDPACPAPGETLLLVRLRRTALTAPVMLDGHALTALIDTGASISLLNARGLHRMGIAPDSLSRDPTTEAMAIGGVFTPHRRTFDLLRVGPLTLRQPELFVSNTPEPAHDIIIGLDILERRRIRLSIATQRLVFMS